MSRTASLACFVVFAACSAESPSSSSAPCSSSSDCPSGQTCQDGTCRARASTDAGLDGAIDAAVPVDLGPAPPPRTLASLAIEPSSVELVSIDGSRPEQDFRGVVTYSDGTTETARGALFTLDERALGDLDPANGHFVASGRVGGVGHVTVTIHPSGGDAINAVATLTVRVERTVRAPEVPADVTDRFATVATDADRAADVVYPLEGAVMPQNVYPADVQWTRGAAGDLFRITLSKPSAVAIAYVAHTGAGFGNHWLANLDAWRSLAQSDPDAPLTITVDRWEAATSTAYTSPPVTMRFARAALSGSVYYWDIGAGRIIRIDDGTATRNEIMPSPPVSLGGDRCVGCHTVSPSGRWMAGRLGGGDNIGAVFDLTTDLTGDPPPTAFPISNEGEGTVRWWFSSWSPDETRLVTEQLQALRLLDPFTGAIVPTAGTPLPTERTTHPAWSPDGTAIAVAADIDAWGGAFTSANIGIIPVMGADTFGAMSIVHRGSDLAGGSPGGEADSYPTWSPDSQWIAFAHGTGCRSEDQTAALYWMRRDGSGVVRLDRGSGGPTSIDSFQPRFSPFTEGGYFWMSFLSRRDYGNSDVGTLGRGLQQIWVTAVRTDGAGGGDASEVAYWLPGQATTSRNIAAYWAPRPCREDGESCSVASECCGGDCRPDESGALVCSPITPDRCHVAGEVCTTDAECCEGLSCILGICQEPIG